ncbi:MAG: 2-C-methyl-D-erythritol 4-phosphate cytidylyltransferase, partial [Clostridia bacterium]
MKSVVILSAGSGARFGADKMNAKLCNGKTVLETSVDKFRNIADEIIIVTRDTSAISTIFPDCKVTLGGQTRSESVARGLLAVDEKCDIVAIHDGARPFVSRQLIATIYNEAEQYCSAVPYTVSTDTVIYKDSPIAREEIKLLQTPQAFSYKKIRALYQTSASSFTDDSQLYATNYPVHYVLGESSNRKIT